MLGYIFFTFWRLFQIVTLIPTLGMLVRSHVVVNPPPEACTDPHQAYFVSLNQKANRLTPASIL